MSYKTIFGEEFENEFDEKMTHKYGDKYKCVKSVYPDVCKLPESEIQPMTYIARYQGDTVDEAKDLVRKYVKEKEPMWKQEYFNETLKNQNNLNIINASKNALEQGGDAIFPSKSFQKIYNLGERLGEFGANGLIAKEIKNKMDQTGNKLVSEFGTGEGRDIDNYYHSLLQCHLAKMGDQSRDNGLWLGDAKEFFDYYKKKYLDKMPEEVILKDKDKDLNNNNYGSRLGYENPNKSCVAMLEHKRTPNMRKMKLW